MWINIFCMNFRMIHVKKLKGATALEMPYKGKRLSMIFILPNEKRSSLADLEEAMSKVTNLNSALKFGYKDEVEVTLPRFKIESEFDLVDPLMQLGMTEMFDGSTADFSGMTGGVNKGLSVSKIVQKAFVEVNEEGTEAAAATAAVLTGRSRQPEPERFICDRPFMFLIRDNLTGMILFSGHVTDPSK